MMAKNFSLFFKILFKITCGFILLGTLFVAGVLIYYASELPDLNNMKTAIRVPSVEIRSCNGKVLGNYGDLYEEVVQIKDLPQHVIAAFVAIEDKRFFTHFGIDFIGLFRALYRNYISHSIVQGGSTITQQLAKNILIVEGCITYKDKSISRKIKELLLALWLEHKFSKTEIMMMYLNRVYFGAGTYGIEAAAKKHFNKHAVQLNVYESALLAGSLKAPTKYNPSENRSYSNNRAMLVLKKMEEQGYIKDAKNIEETNANNTYQNNIRCDNSQYFCNYAYDQAKKILGDLDSDIVVTTTFDENKQKIAEEAVSYYYKNERDTYKFKQVAFLCVDRNGAIQAMIGGIDYQSNQFNRVVQAQRFPGSAFKIIVYGAALEYGYQLYDQISDEPISIGTWHPKNFGWKSKGYVSLLSGFSHSVNTVCVRLAQSIGLKRVAQFAKKLGITNVSEEDMSVALGTTPVTLKDLTGVYAAFMDGYYVAPYCVLEIKRKNGEVIYSREEPEPIEVLDDEVLNNCRDLLHEVVQAGTGRAAKVNYDVYGKTGTNGETDAWFMGFYDPEKYENEGCAVGVWVGNDILSDKMTRKSTGGRIPARIAAMYLKNVIKYNEQNRKNHPKIDNNKDDDEDEETISNVKDKEIVRKNNEPDKTNNNKHIADNNKDTINSSANNINNNDENIEDNNDNNTDNDDSEDYDEDYIENILSSRKLEEFLDNIEDD
ncbi:MAG: transglycosylase domain-containing protein [Alphaproteobacteria bacterium]|nr:transglycosylase domain-containing protein [Alphaproteobacteria bacterium]